MAPEGTALLVVALPTSPTYLFEEELEKHMNQLIIGVDPHKLSATIEVVDDREKLLGSGQFPTDQAGYAAMRTYVKTWPDRVWAIEGANGTGRSLAQRLLEAGEHVVDVPAKLAARVRLFDTGHNRKTDARDAHSVAMVAVRTKGCPRTSALRISHFPDPRNRRYNRPRVTGEDQRPETPLGILTTEGSRYDAPSGTPGSRIGRIARGTPEGSGESARQRHA